MHENVKSRRYISPKRQEQALATRGAILDAASKLFVEKGYAATSIREIAAAAGVAEPTVYAVFKGKPSILWAIGERLIVEGEDAVEFSESKVVQSIKEASDLCGRLDAMMRWSLQTYRNGIADLDEVVMQAAAADPRLEDLMRAGIKNQVEQGSMIVELLTEVAQLKPGFSPEDVRDLLVTMNGAGVYRMLVKEMGWSLEKYGQWMIRIAESFFVNEANSAERSEG